MQHVRDLFRELATFDPGDAFVLSVYLDMRPHVPGENPAIRTGLIVIKDRFRQIDKTCCSGGGTTETIRDGTEK